MKSKEKPKQAWKEFLHKVGGNTLANAFGTILAWILIPIVTATGALFYFKGFANKLRAVATIRLPIPVFVVVLVSLAVGALTAIAWLAKQKQLHEIKKLEERIAEMKKEKDPDPSPPRRRPRSPFGSGVGLRDGDDFD